MSIFNYLFKVSQNKYAKNYEDSIVKNKVYNKLFKKNLSLNAYLKNYSFQAELLGRVYTVYTA